MAAPTVATESGDDDPGLEADDEADEAVGESLDEARELAEGAAETPEPDDDPDVAEVDLTDDDLGGSASDLFTGTDDATTDSDDSALSTDDDGDSDDEEEDTDALDALGARGESMEEAINDGAARLAVVGLDDEDDKDGLQEEFTEVFEAFRLGYFGSRFFEEYVFTDDDEVDPMWGLFGAALTCTAFIVWMRPDGDEMVQQAREAVEGLIGGSLT
ncbi:hypothetical protein K745_gp16 [Haloarcula hispanica virus PH1]|uniref:Uncharacterized protein n=1 Tax=Haloarcula hispanica virus PH1 TaxID=1282967 RepID=M4JFL7_9VIRU|nr:hypothetical protein K745_gp16 [Haloarcula hispanica virus PH1]AGC65541.1 hypothetical protein HhPH1_gp16 [Haloarcula hispanica virus PH1]